MPAICFKEICLLFWSFLGFFLGGNTWWNSVLTMVNGRERRVLMAAIGVRCLRRPLRCRRWLVGMKIWWDGWFRWWYCAIVTLDSARNRKWAKNDGAVAAIGIRMRWRLHNIVALDERWSSLHFCGVGLSYLAAFEGADVMVMANFARRSLAREEEGLSLTSKY